MTQPAQERLYCSDLSLQAGETLIGTATQTNAYLLLEYNGKWGGKALEESSLPETVRDRLQNFSKIHPHTKALMVRRMHSVPGARLNFMLAAVGEQSSALYAFQLSTYEDLLALDFAAILAGASEYQAYRRSDPLFLVCTHGRRDACCARHGIAVYEALEQATQTAPLPLIWQSSHLGGHRFAANLLALPEGLLYGRVDASSALHILQAHQQGQIHLPRLRGRTSLPPAAQAAEIHLRQALGITDIQALELMELREIPPLGWQVEFFAPQSGEAYRLQIGVKEMGVKIFESCTLDKSTTLREFIVIS